MRQLVIDGQVFQSIARHRGMGRYSEYLVSAIIDRSEYETVTVVYSSRYDHVDDVSFHAKSIYLDLMDATAGDVDAAEAHNQATMDTYIQTVTDQPDQIDFLILSPFQEPLVSVFPTGVAKHLVFYDLIPYLYYDQYIDKMSFDKYLRHYRLLFEADRLLAISQTAAEELSLYIGIPSQNIVAIDGAPIRAAVKPKKPTSIKVPKDYILLPTGDDPRKNNYRAVEAFHNFANLQKKDVKLVITSNIHPSERQKLQKLSNKLLFTGNLDEAELDWMYLNAMAVLFISESEGLGLPILEAMHAGKPVVCSQLDVFKEISESALYYCDQKNVADISRALSDAIKSGLSASQKKEYQKALRHYTWPQTAKRTIAAMQSAAPQPLKAKPKIAVFTPRPDGISAIGKVVAEAHAELQKEFDVDYYIENGSAAVQTRPDFLKYVATCYPAASFSVKAYQQYDAVFYHIGNSDYHLSSIANSLYLPGYVVIHDTNISDAYKEMMEQGMISAERQNLEVGLNAALSLKYSRNLVSVVTNQLGVMTHSQYAADAVSEILGAKTPIVKVAKLPTHTVDIHRTTHSDNLHIGMAGIIADIKGTEVIESLVKKNELSHDHFHIFGYNYSDPETMKRLATYQNVELATNVSDREFVTNMKQLDIFVNYRMQYQGETSLSTLEAMRQGVVVIVRNIGWYAELPDDVVVKVDTIEEVAVAVRRLSRDRALLMTIASAAHRYVSRHHSHVQYVTSMRQLIKVGTAKKTLQHDIAELLHSGKIKSANELLEKRKDKDI